MSTIHELASATIPLLLLLAALMVPFRCGLIGERFRTALLLGWAFFFLSLLSRDLINPTTPDSYQPTHLFLTKAGAILGWFPACSLFLLGKLARVIFRLKGKTISWSRLTLVIALAIPLLWWPGSRLYYYVWMDQFGTMPALDTDFSQLSRVMPPADASLVAIHRGLPHQMWARDDLWHDLFMTSNRAIKSFRFYTEPIAFPAPLGEDISKAFKSSSLYRRYGGPKLCGGYHPDLCLEWTSAKEQGPFYALLCQGCGEVRLVGNGATVHCDMADESFTHLRGLLKQFEAQVK